MQFRYLIIFFIFLEIWKINSYEVTTTRSYPDYWLETTSYTYDYLDSKYSIKEKGSDIIALSSLLISMKYPIHPAQLNAYIIQKNGTYDHGKKLITYYPGNILNWEGFKNLGLQYLGEYDDPGQFLHLYSLAFSDIHNFGVLAMIRDSYLINGTLFTQYQYVHVTRILHYIYTIEVQNPNIPQRQQIYYRNVIKYIVFKRISNGTVVSVCSDAYLLHADRAQCLSTNTVYMCIRYIQTSSTQRECALCRYKYYLNANKICVSCPDNCQYCRLDQKGEVQCLGCGILQHKSKQGCIKKQLWCKQMYRLQNGNIQCAQCYDGAYESSRAVPLQHTCHNCQDYYCYACSDYYTCTKCYPPYTLNSSDDCYLDPSIDYTENCKITYNGYCQLCQQPFDNFNGLCVDCQNQFANHQACHNSHKLRCLEFSDYNCTKCKQGFRLANNRFCIIDPYQKCLDFFYENPGCMLCESGYYLNDTQVCVPCQNGYTDYESPYNCFSCKQLLQVASQQCIAQAIDGDCICSGNVVHFILQIKANQGNFFQESVYRKSKMYQSFAYYLGIDFHSIKTLSFEYIKNGDQTFYVFVGYIHLTVNDFKKGVKLQIVEQKLKNTIFDFTQYIVMSVYTRIGSVEKEYTQQLSTELQQIQEQEQEGISKDLIMICVFGGALLYIGLIFMCNYYKNTVKECSKQQSKKIQPQNSQRQLKTRKQSSKLESQTLDDLNHKGKQIQRNKRINYQFDIEDV